jgi:hypothetical protein
MNLILFGYVSRRALRAHGQDYHTRPVERDQCVENHEGCVRMPADRLTLTPESF